MLLSRPRPGFPDLGLLRAADKAKEIRWFHLTVNK
ncbi:hypothetical protein CLOLEP_00747 [[Clostridium] leptum DSM 753]|jgi:hypothetical protein|uniref:Uncharacterized protein n=1 Tax=[Clostridium] leptum DSM 753 TaxID=428125 RepID=A7VQB9_9FIRM|nr:hypothetical protein CLOLEP_00747 [[Clostridium] leptum DSM 753]